MQMEKDADVQKVFKQYWMDLHSEIKSHDMRIQLNNREMYFYIG